MRFCGGFGNGKSDAGALHPAGVGLIHAVETLKNAGNIRVLFFPASIKHLDFHFAGAFLHKQGNPAPYRECPHWQEWRSAVFSVRGLHW